MAAALELASDAGHVEVDVTGGEPRPTLSDLRIDRRDAGGRRRLRGWLALAIALLVVAAVAGVVWVRGDGEPAPAPEPAAAAAGPDAAAPRGAGSVLDASGYVIARRRSTISSKVTGRIEEVLIEEGMRVEQGQPLARLDAGQVRAHLALAEAQLGASRQAVEETRVRLAEARVEQRRQESLVASGIASPAALDAARAAADSLAARLALGAEEVEVAERQVALRREDLGETVIRAPFAGMVVSKDAQPGEMISPVSAGGGFTRTGICTLVDMASLEIEVDVNEAYIQRVRPGQRVTAVLSAYPDLPLPAHVITTIPTADRQKATVRVRIGFDELDPRVLPEMGVEVRFHDDERGGAAD